MEIEMRDTNVKNRKFLALLLPILSVGIVMILFNLLDAVSGFVLTKCETTLSIDSTIQYLLTLFIAQLITVTIVIFVFMPFFRVKYVEIHPISNTGLRITIVLFFLALGSTFLSSLVFTCLFTALKWESQTGYSEMILTAELMSNPFNMMLFLVSMTIGAALFEEMVYRRLLIPLLENYQVVPSTAVIVSSIMFAMAHLNDDLVNGNISGAIIHSVGVFLLAMVLGITYILTRNVLFPILIHAISNLFGSLNILLMVIGNEGLLTIYSILILVMLVIGLGVTIYLVWKCFYGSKPEVIFVIWNKIEFNEIIGLIGFIVVGSVLVYIPMVLEIFLTLLEINSDLNRVLFILCIVSILVMLVRLAVEIRLSLNEETMNTSS